MAPTADDTADRNGVLSGPSGAGANGRAAYGEGAAGNVAANGAVPVRAPDPAVPDLVEVGVPAGGRVVVVSDLHLPGTATAASATVAGEITALLADWSGPGVFVIAGDGFELLAGPPDIGRVLDAHPALTAALASFAAGGDRQLVVMPGNHDGQLAWDGGATDLLGDRLGVAHVALAADLHLTTGAGPQVVRVVHGNQADPYNAFEDPRSPVDTPFGHHVVRQILPELEARQQPGSLLDGVQWLDGDAADFVGSRLLYRKVVGKLWLIAIPFVAALVLRFAAFFPGVSRLLHHHAQRWLIGLGVLVVLMLAVAAVAAVATMLRVNRALRDSALSERADPAAHNAPARREASHLVTEGFAGLVSGHTHEPELSVVGNGFYANTGSGTTSVAARRSRFRLPRPYVAVERFSYVELEASSVLRVSLFLRETPRRSESALERLAMARSGPDLVVLTEVASLPAGPTWPLHNEVLQRVVHRRLVRQVAAGLLLAAGLLNVIFAFLWSVQGTRGFDSWLPFGIHPLSGVGAVAGGLALCGLARGVRRGIRLAWAAALIVLLASTVNRLVQSHGLGGSIIAGLIGLWLLFEHDNFRVSPSGVSRWVGTASVGGLVTVAVAAGIDALFQHGHREARDAVVLIVLGTLVLAVLVTLPTREHRRTGAARRQAFDRALGVLTRYGGDTLDYFALRDDKSWLFSGHTLVAYSVINGVMLVSPDPIGPPEERATAWADAMDLAQSNGWVPSVLAASASWLPVYRASGLVDHYIGDEAVVDCSTFTLKGKSMKSLRGAYNRVKKAGYRVEVLDPADAGPQLRQELVALMTETRQGEAERGYSMTLSRIFDPRDRGLLLAVCIDPEGRPTAFNQYVPAAHVDGYSLDLMRRTNEPDAPNGLTDYVIIETIAWMAEHGLRGLGLNFATMRAVVAGERRGGPWLSMERTALHHFSETLQIESLWKFNKKYDPRWVPRYAVTGPYLRVASSAIAIARAEAVTELPLIGRLLRSHETDPATEPAPGA